MTIRKVLRSGHPRLRSAAEPVPESVLDGEALEVLLADMLETMRDENGVGLAAPQVQESLRVLLYEIHPNPRYEDVEEEVPPTVLINPEVIDRSETVEEDWEGCLSLPDLRGRVPRHTSLRIRALDRRGEVIERRVEGFEARVIQHEMDHLDGVLFPDRMESMESLCFLEEYRRYHAPAPEETDGGEQGGAKPSSRG